MSDLNTIDNEFHYVSVLPGYTDVFCLFMVDSYMLYGNQKTVYKRFLAKDISPSYYDLILILILNLHIFQR